MLAKITMLHAVAGALDGSDKALLVLEWRANALIVREINDAFRRMGDYLPEHLIGQDFGLLVAAESAAELAQLRDAAAAGKAYRGELLAVARAGGHFWFGLHMMKCDGRAESAGLFVVLGRDITQRRAEAQQSAKVQSMLARVFMLADVPIAILDGEGRIAMVNAAHERVLGGKSADWAGRTALELAAPAARARLQEAQQQAGHSPLHIEVDLQSIDGGMVPVQLSSIGAEADRQAFRVVTLAPLPARGAAHLTEHGKIKLISLAEVRAHLGAQYQHLVPRVMATAQHVLEHRLGPHDSALPTAQGDFSVCFPELDGEEAEMRANAIGHEIRTKLIGDHPDAAV